MTSLRLIRVGMGGWGRSWATLTARLGELAHAVAYVDVQPAMLQQLQTDLGVSADMCFRSLEAALVRTDAEAVLVTTALAGHVPVVLQALAANKHVLVEKPFAPSLAEAQQAVALAAAQQRVLMVSQNYRCLSRRANRCGAGPGRRAWAGKCGAYSVSQIRQHRAAGGTRALHACAPAAARYGDPPLRFDALRARSRAGND
jgi:hypothetical protein